MKINKGKYQKKYKALFYTTMYILKEHYLWHLRSCGEAISSCEIK